VRVYLSAGGVYGYADFPGRWPGTDGDWPGLATLASLAEAMAQTTRECPVCPDVPISAFLRALAESAPPSVARNLRDLAARWS